VIPRSYLYVPADKTEMLEKAGSRGADALIIDLEDSVSQSNKELAFKNLESWLNSTTVRQQIWVRIESQSIEEYLEVADHEKVYGIVVPKANLKNLQVASSRVKKVKNLSALIETADSILTAYELAKVSKVCFLQAGLLDLRAELGLPMDGESSTIKLVLSHLVLASAAAKINQPIAPIFRDFSDADGLRRSCISLRESGFFGRTCIHPKQIQVINEEFSISDIEIVKAKAILNKLENQGAISDKNGGMIDLASGRIAQRIIDRSRD